MNFIYHGEFSPRIRLELFFKGEFCPKEFRPGIPRGVFRPGKIG